MTEITEYEPSDEAKKMFDSFWTEANKRQISSSENYDKSILTYSSALLGLSLTFLKDFIPVKIALHIWLLYGSWTMFVLAIIVTVISFSLSYKAQEKSVDFAEKYFLKGDESFRNKKCIYDHVLKWFNRTSGLSFVVAIVMTSLFVGVNLDKVDATSSKDITNKVQAASEST